MDRELRCCVFRGPTASFDYMEPTSAKEAVMTSKKTDPEKRQSEELNEDQLQEVSGGLADDMPDLLADPRPSPVIDLSFAQVKKVEKGEK